MRMQDTLQFIHFIADYGSADLAFAEVVQRLKATLPTATIFPTTVPAFSTLATGFTMAQLALNDPIPNMFIYSNTAPRKDDTEARHENAGEPFMYGLLDNGVRIAAVSAGYAFSFLKPHLKDLRLINVPHHGSQFRSRDFFPQAVAGLINHNKKFLGEKLKQSTIPDIPPNKIMYIDGYGNIKTTIRSSQVKFKPGEKIRISIIGNVRTGVYADANFSVKTGDLAFAPGSSGGKDRFMEIFLRGGSASKLFYAPPIESDITLTRFEN